jgi:hypothetical protein
LNQNVLKHPALSVVVPLYNKSRCVERAIRSALAQTYTDFELIVVDDGSTDNGVLQVEAIGDLRIRVLRQENAGVSAARNRGTRESNAPWIAFLDADDEWSPTHLATLMGLINEFPNCGFVASGYVVKDAQGVARPSVLRGIPSGSWRGMIDDYFSVAWRSDPPVWSSAVAIRRSALDSIDGFPVGIGQGEDLLTWARLAARVPLAYSSEATATFWNEQSDSHRPKRTPEVPDCVGTALKQLIEEAPQRLLPSMRKYLGLWHKMRGTMFLRLNRRSDACYELREALHLMGFRPPLVAYWMAASMPEWMSGATVRVASSLNRVLRATHRKSIAQ